MIPEYIQKVVNLAKQADDWDYWMLVENSDGVQVDINVFYDGFALLWKATEYSTYTDEYQFIHTDTLNPLNSFIV